MGIINELGVWVSDKFKRRSDNEINSKLDVVIDLMRINFDRYRKELDEWQMARDYRLDVDRPITYYLQEVYTDLMMDAHLRALIENRILRIVNREFVIQNAAGEVDSTKTKLIAKPWFSDCVRMAMESIFFGYSVILIKRVDRGNIREVQCIPREHVLPERREIIRHPFEDTEGLPFEDLQNHLLYVQLYDSIGLLEAAAPMTILKRHSWASWDEFEQIFGIPLRIAKIASNSAAKKREAANWLDAMGRGSSAVLNVGDEVEVVSNTQSDAFRVFLEKVSAVNSELSKLINGQTMTTDDGSSRSQADVHMKTQDEITRADEREVLYWLNEQLKPVLRYHGYPISDSDEFSIFRQDDPKERIEIDKHLISGGYPLSAEYIEKTYKVQLDEIPAAEPDPTKKPLPKPSAGKPLDKIEDFFF